MRHGKLGTGLALAGAFSIAFSLAPPAKADYAPTSLDVVGVGSDTLQYAMDFVADGDALGDPGYNSAGNTHKLIYVDATDDGNGRLAFGPPGTGSGECNPGDGTITGTGNQAATHADQACTLNPTVVIRAGIRPIQRPDGSLAGAQALAADTSHFITFAATSSCEGDVTCPVAGPLSTAFDSIEIGQDTIAMLSAATTHAEPLSLYQLAAIYECTDTRWNQVGGTSADAVIPILPTLGSGIRQQFLADIDVKSTSVGSCVVTAENDDPTAIAEQADPADAIEPMSASRLDLYSGLLNTGTSNGVGGYFTDPSCPLQAVDSSSPAACGGPGNTISPPVKLITSGKPSDGSQLFDFQYPLYIYFRDSAVNSAGGWQPGGTLNAVRTLFYNPCKDNPPVAGDGCTTVDGQTFGPGGPPLFDTSMAQADLAAAGITPEYVPEVGGP
jgi:ABC-type phosphate transport system substrate-binding protein